MVVQKDADFYGLTSCLLKLEFASTPSEIYFSGISYKHISTIFSIGGEPLALTVRRVRRILIHISLTYHNKLNPESGRENWWSGKGSAPQDLP